ncbi:MAG: type II toxin-antitoxin system Phd/YefM family antitoxin [Blastocatellia bacterium]
MSTVIIEEAQPKLSEIIHRMQPGEEVVITEDDQPIAPIVPAEPIAKRVPRRPGTQRHCPLYGPRFRCAARRYQGVHGVWRRHQGGLSLCSTPPRNRRLHVGGFSA